MKLVVAACLALGLGVAACGDDDGGAGASGMAGAAGSAGMSGGGGDAERDSVCGRLCLTMEPLHCPREATCMQDCLTLWDAPGCELQGHLLIRCAVLLPADAWTCGPNGDADTQECDAPFRAFTACLDNRP